MPELSENLQRAAMTNWLGGKKREKDRDGEKCREERGRESVCVNEYKWINTFDNDKSE